MTFFLIFTEFICRKMKGDTLISGKKIAEENAMESSRIRVGGVFQDGLIPIVKSPSSNLFSKENCAEIFSELHCKLSAKTCSLI